MLFSVKPLDKGCRANLRSVQDYDKWGGPRVNETDLAAALAAAESGMGVAYWASRAPERVAVCERTRKLTFHELNARANALVRALRASGLKAGDGVALLCSNRLEYAEVTVARERSGMRLIPLNWHLSISEIAYIVQDSDARAIIADAAFAEVASAVAVGLDIRLAVGGPIVGFDDYDQLIALQPTNDIDDPLRGSTMTYTSGTTGRPKGVYRPEDPVVTIDMINFYDYRGDSDAALCTGPLYHTAVLAYSLILPLLAGTRIVLMEAWDAKDTLRLIAEEHITHTHMVPIMFSRLLALPAEVRASADLSSLRFVIHGAAPCPVAVKLRMIEWLGPIIWEYYAATEGRATLCDPTTWLLKPGTVGRPVVDGAVVVGDAQGRPLPPGVVGLLWLRSTVDTAFHYWRDEVKTAEAYRGDLFTLGDVGYADDEGYLYLTDRSSDLIISGGVNIYPAEVDAVLIEHPLVADSATIGEFDEQWGERVLSLIELLPGVEANTALAEELIAWARDHMAHYKSPKRVEFVVSVPRSEAGKVLRSRLRAEYRTHT